jgi:copper chaperone CopZ
MPTMRTLPILSLLLVLSLFLAPSAALAGPVTYTAEMKGIECAGCKKTITRSIGQIPGVKSIRIAKLAEDKHRLIIVTDGSAPISKAQAVAALGKDSHYEIVSWGEKG